MFIALYPMPLPESLFQQLSAGAVKLLVAIQAEPDAPQARYIELVGKCERSVRNFGRELLEMRLVRRTAQPKAETIAAKQTTSDTRPKTKAAQTRDDQTTDLTDVQRASYQQLRQFRIAPHVAHDLAQQCDESLIIAAITYTRQRNPLKPTGYLVWCLKNPTKWYCVSSPVLDFSQVSPIPPKSKSATAPSPMTSIISSFESTNLVASVPKYQPASPTPESPIQTAALVVPDQPMSVSELVVTRDNLDIVLLAYAVEAATGADLRLNREAQQVVMTLHEAGYTAEDVGRFADEIFPQTDWRGQNGERPTVPILLTKIGAVHHCKDSWPLGGLFARVQAIRNHLPTQVSIRYLSDLWPVVEAVVAAEGWAASHCPECDKPVSMCLCVQHPA